MTAFANKTSAKYAIFFNLSKNTYKKVRFRTYFVTPKMVLISSHSPQPNISTPLISEHAASSTLLIILLSASKSTQYTQLYPSREYYTA